MATKFYSICSKVRENPQNAIKKLGNLFPDMANQMIEVCGRIPKESVRNLLHDCYSFNLPDLDAAAQKAIIFLYGTKEPARFCIFRLKKYKCSRVIKKSDFNHCGYLLLCPKEYAEMLKKNSGK